MKYLLDTNICIDLLNNKTGAVARKLPTIVRRDVYICQIVKAELYYGTYKSSRREANLKLADWLSSEFGSLPFDEKAVKAYGEIRAKLERKGLPIGPNDLIVAAIAKAHDAVLVTNNVQEFERVDGIRIEDWLASV